MAAGEASHRGKAEPGLKPVTLAAIQQEQLQSRPKTPANEAAREGKRAQHRPDQDISRMVCQHAAKELAALEARHADVTALLKSKQRL